MEHIFYGIAGAAVFRIEVEAACKSACLQHLIHTHGCVIDIERELVRIPAKEHVALIGIDAAQHPVDGADAQVMLEGVAGQGRMVGFDIHLEVLVQTVLS